MKSLTVRLDDKTHKEFKIVLAKNGQKAQEVLERAVKEYIKNTDFPKRIERA